MHECVHRLASSRGASPNHARCRICDRTRRRQTQRRYEYHGRPRRICHMHNCYQMAAAKLHGAMAPRSENHAEARAQVSRASLSAIAPEYISVCNSCNPIHAHRNNVSQFCMPRCLIDSKNIIGVFKCVWQQPVCRSMNCDA